MQWRALQLTEKEFTTFKHLNPRVSPTNQSIPSTRILHRRSSKGTTWPSPEATSMRPCTAMQAVHPLPWICCSQTSKTIKLSWATTRQSMKSSRTPLSKMMSPAPPAAVAQQNQLTCLMLRQTKIALELWKHGTSNWVSHLWRDPLTCTKTSLCPQRDRLLWLLSRKIAARSSGTCWIHTRTWVRCSARPTLISTFS